MPYHIHSNSCLPLAFIARVASGHSAGRLAVCFEPWKAPNKPARHSGQPPSANSGSQPALVFVTVSSIRPKGGFYV